MITGFVAGSGDNFIIGSYLNVASFLRRVVLCCFVLFCVVLCCFVLCCVVLCCVELCCVVLCCVVLCCVVLSCVVLFYLILFYLFYPRRIGSQCCQFAVLFITMLLR